MGSGGGTDSESRRDPFADRRKAAGSRTDATRMSGARKREEQRLQQAAFVSGDQSYVQGGGNIVRSATTGAGVLTGTGVQRAEASRQQELEALISRRQGGSGDPEAEKRAMAIQQLEKRMAQTLPGTLGVVARMNVERQLRDLRAGGTPQFGMTAGGTFLTRGVTPEGRSEPLADAPNIQPMFGQTRQGADVTPEVTPVVTPEIVPDDAPLMGQPEPAGRGLRRTRGTRLGQAGDPKNEYGALYRR